jgi:hypothetical protein
MDCFATLAMTGRHRPSTRSSSPRRRGSSTPRLFGSITAAAGILDHPPSRVMTTEYAFAFSRRVSPEVCIFVCPLRNRGHREDRVLAAPAVSRAICANKTAHEHTGQRETLRPSLRNGFTAYFVLFPENGSFASVIGDTSRQRSASTAAPEPHDFTVRVRRVRLARRLRPPHLTARS